MNVTVFNSLFARSKLLTLNIVSDFKNVNLMIDVTNNVVQNGANVTYKVSYDSLGEPSCVAISKKIILFKNDNTIRFKPQIFQLSQRSTIKTHK